MLINLCLAGLVIWVGFNIFLTWRSAKEEKRRPQARPAKSGGPVATAVARPKKQRDYQIIVVRDIFDTTKGGSANKKEKIVKVTDLDLKLKGTVIGGTRNSFAVIQDGTTMKEELYAINDFIQGARIVEILADQVILDLKGSRESLLIAEETSPAATRMHSRKRARRPRISPRKSKRPKRSKTIRQSRPSPPRRRGARP
ncbi:MAG: hypothetical protein GY849_20175 [Deltaproteobacteria bacterium]|nr:hypothetical protein [Deltaproteobacteria bacterium]